ncbi:MAG: hypothetical protein ABRQ39_11900 [Candidatus Eremiobacterota bacterium]
MQDDLLINKLFKTYNKYASFIVEDKDISSETVTEKKEAPPVDREKEGKFLLLLEKNFKKYSFDF